MVFAIEATIKLKNSQTVTQDKSYWLLPSAVQKVEGKPVKDIYFTSAKSKKKQLDTAISNCNSLGTPLQTKQQKNVQKIPPPSDDELSNFFKGLHETGTKPVLFSLIPQYAAYYRPKALDKKFPLVLSELTDENFISVQKETLMTHCEEIFRTLSVQCQLLVCEKEYCDFIVWTEADFHAERIEIDNDICDSLLVKSKLFFSNAILPEPSVDTSINTEVRDQALAACSSVPLRDISVNVDNSINSCDNSRTGSSRLIILDLSEGIQS
ncbi:unnamed protein product [Mytilus coruscus]|uniref:Uncharacterized protein n=1 Tax=Mytilus coruscus TaxID=42192 RepID=A0A6J8BV93_MYTCO|nr:unnamed protein product [Mytilus coruscus]